MFTHGAEEDRAAGHRAFERLAAAGFDVEHQHSPERLDFGTARNNAVAMSSSEWVMHLDCDDQIMPHALGDFAELADKADVIGAGYERSGDLRAGPSNRHRIYSATTGLEALKVVAPCSGVSPFRRSFWERSPYRTDMLGAWDTALWIGFARLGARFRPTRRPVFWYRQHADSVFNRRRKVFDWTHFVTVAQLKSLRAGHQGVGVIVPRDQGESSDRMAAWTAVRRHYERHHPTWEIVEGASSADYWLKGEAIADALTRSTAAVLVIADADCLIPPTQLEASVDLVSSGKAPWAVPHGRVLRLSPATTVDWLGRLEADPAELPEVDLEALARPAYAGFPGGGVFVVPRAVYEAAGGIPSVFRGWGSEDQAIGAILDCLAGSHVRGSADLVHLWHEPQPTKGMVTGNHQRYAAIAAAAKQGRDPLLRALQHYARPMPAKPTAPGGRSWADRASQQQDRKRGYLAERGKPGAP